MIVVPVGGGGLIAGIAIAAKAIKPDIKIIGVQAKVCPSAKEAIRQGSPYRISAGKTIADGIRVAETGARTLPLIQHFVDQLVLASEEEIADAMLLLLERKHIVAEGAGAVPLAAIMNGSIDVEPGTLARLLSVIAKERGNILHIHHTQGDSDIPVQMAKVTIELETRGWEHIASIKKALLDNGYEIRMVSAKNINFYPKKYI